MNDGYPWLFYVMLLIGFAGAVGFFCVGLMTIGAM